MNWYLKIDGVLPVYMQQDFADNRAVTIPQQQVFDQILTPGLTENI